MPRCCRISNTGIQYTPVDCITTLWIPCPLSQSAIVSISSVKQSKLRTGLASFSGLMATQCSLPPMSMPAACGCTTSNAFPSTLGGWAFLFGSLWLMTPPVVWDLLGPVPIRYKSFQRGQTRGVAVTSRHQCKGSEENRSHAEARVSKLQSANGLSLPSYLHSRKRVNWTEVSGARDVPPGRPSLKPG